MPFANVVLMCFHSIGVSTRDYIKIYTYVYTYMCNVETRIMLYNNVENAYNNVI